MLVGILNELRKNPIWLITIAIIVLLVLINVFYVGAQKSAFSEKKDEFLKKSVKYYFCSEHQDAIYYDPVNCNDCNQPLKEFDPFGEHITPVSYVCILHPDQKSNSPGNCLICGYPLLPNDPSKDSIKALRNYAKTLKNQEKKIMDFYSAGDANLERWFDGIKVEATGLPEKTMFKLKHDDEMGKIKDKFIRNEVRLQSSFASRDAEKVFPEPDSGSFYANENLKTIQKQFNITSYVVSNLFSKNASNPEKALISQFERMAFDTNIGGGKGVYGEFLKLYWECGKNKYSSPAWSGFAYGETITFGFAVKLPYENVAEVIGNLMDTSSSNRIYVRITGIQIRKLEPLIEERKLNPNQSDFEAGNYQPSEWYTPNSVILVVVGEVYDFNLATNNQK